MNNEAGYVLFGILPALLSTIYVAYLTYIVTNPIRLKVKLTKYKSASNLELYQKIYSKHYLYGWLCMALLFVSGVAFEYYKSAVKPSAAATLSMLILTLFLVIAGGSFIFRALKK